MDRFTFVLVFALLMAYAEKSTSLNFRILSSNTTNKKGSKVTKDGTPTTFTLKGDNNTSLKSKGSHFSTPTSGTMPSNDSKSDTNPSMTERESNETHKIPPLSTPSAGPVNSTKIPPRPSLKNATMKAPVSMHPPPPTGLTQQSKSHQSNETQGGRKVPIDIRNQHWCNYSSKCMDHKNLLACLHVIQNGSMELVVFNAGEDDLSVNVTTIDLAHHEALQLQLKKYQKKEFVWAAITPLVSKIILNAGNGDCVINQRHSSSWIQSYGNMIPPSYNFLVTPTYGAYFLAVVIFTVWGICVCCKLRRGRQRHGGVQYQELEMGPPESDCLTTTPVGKQDAADPSDGWDQNWDDDWEEDDEEQPRARRANGHGSNALEDGWEDKWDD